MRAGKGLAVVIGLALAGSAPAQGVNFGGFGSNWSAGNIVNQPIEFSTSVVPIASPMYQPERSFWNPLSFMPRTTRMNNTPVHGVSAFPTPNQMPGTQYLQSFNYTRPNQTLGLFS